MNNLKFTRNLQLHVRIHQICDLDLFLEAIKLAQTKQGQIGKRIAIIYWISSAWKVSNIRYIVQVIRTFFKEM